MQAEDGVRGSGAFIDVMNAAGGYLKRVALEREEFAPGRGRHRSEEGAEPG